MGLDDQVVLTTNGDPPCVSLAQLARMCQVDVAQVIRWTWTGRIEAPTPMRRTRLWRRSEAIRISRDGPGIPGMFPSLPHFDGLRLIDAARQRERYQQRRKAGASREQARGRKGGVQ